jgi:hypothetical protein
MKLLTIAIIGIVFGFLWFVVRPIFGCTRYQDDIPLNGYSPDDITKVN